MVDVGRMIGVGLILMVISVLIGEVDDAALTLESIRWAESKGELEMLEKIWCWLNAVEGEM